MMDIWAWVIEQVNNNEIFAGFMGLSALGGIMWLVRGLPNLLATIITRQFTVELVVHNTDSTFYWVQLWLSKQPYARRARRIQLTGDRSEDGEDWVMGLGTGNHLLTYHRSPMLVNHSVSDEESRSGFMKESYSLRTIGRSQALLKALVKESRELSTTEDLTKIYSYCGYWQRVVSMSARPLESVVMPLGVIERIVQDATNFYNSQSWYLKCGIPWRRGYLFSGTPGTGKTSLVVALAGYFKRPLYVINLGAIASDSDLLEAFNSVPKYGLILIEDIDATGVTESRNKKSKNKDEKGVTLSGLLNVIDGAIAGDGRLLIMTSNHPDHLDPALIRPGRVDINEEFLPLGYEEAVRMHQRFLPNEDSTAFAHSLKLPLPAAKVQSLLIELTNKNR